MAPTLRSSTPNTPNNKSTAAGLKNSSSITPRKAPTCTKCKRPKAGHPRSGCPYPDSQTTTDKTSTENAGQTIVDALGSMHLQSPPRRADDDTRAAIRQRRRSSLAAALAITQSVVSLDTEAQEDLDSLMQPGIFDNSSGHSNTPATVDNVVQWQETLTPTRSTRKRVKMPGSLSSPSPYSSQGSIKLDEEPSPIASTNITNDDPIMTPTLNSTPPASIPAVQPLSRSMSMEQVFFSTLDNTSHATVFDVPCDDIHSIQATAIKLGFYARVVLGKGASEPQCRLVLGRNEVAVKRLHEQLEAEPKQSTGLRAATAGAVVGAVGAFAGLAFT